MYGFTFTHSMGENPLYSNHNFWWRNNKDRETKGREESFTNLLGDSNSGYLIFKHKILLNK